MISATRNFIEGKSYSPNSLFASVLIPVVVELSERLSALENDNMALKDCLQDIRDRMNVVEGSDEYDEYSVAEIKKLHDELKRLQEENALLKDDARLGQLVRNMPSYGIALIRYKGGWQAYGVIAQRRHFPLLSSPEEALVLAGVKVPDENEGAK